MTTEEMKHWIDNAPYKELLKKWRFAPIGDPLFDGEIGDHYIYTMRLKKNEVGHDEHVRISKEIGWR